MIPVWADDVSGNKSKQYNKHINLYMVNSCLPRQLLQQEYFIHFVSTSPHATSPEQFSALRDQVHNTEKNPVRCFNAHTKRPCHFILHVPALPADNPQQSEEASHIGGNANMGCRKCHAGGCHEHTESDSSYDALHYAKICLELEKQIHQAMQGVEKTVSDMQTATGVKDKENPGHTPESIAEELQQWFDEQPGDKINPLLDIAVRLQATDIDGLTVPPIHARYIMQYWNNLIGKHFKTLMQTMVFHVHEIVMLAQFNLVKAAGALGALLWVHEIENMDEYLVVIIKPQAMILL
ncbi:hypothetical protein IW262DRAFT_1450617 [Armillaria fumosa]|nr:hypothetical protein IW262DRAFT_1450617 [Armillaria fumosa]